MSTELTDAATATESLSIAEGREQFLRQCVELYLSAEAESGQVNTGGNPLADETAHEPRAAKPHELYRNRSA